MPVPPPPNCSWSMARLTDPEPSYQVLITASCALCASPFADLGSCGSTAQDIPQPHFPFAVAEASGSLPHRRIPFIHPGYPAPTHLLRWQSIAPIPPWSGLFVKALPRAAPLCLPLARPAPPCSATDHPADLPPSLVRPPHYRLHSCGGTRAGWCGAGRSMAKFSRPCGRLGGLPPRFLYYSKPTPVKP